MKNESIDQALQQLAEALKSDNDPTAQGSSILFKDKIHSKGMLWAGKDYTKQLVYIENPSKIFSSESIDLAKGQALLINNLRVLSDTELGTTVTKSNLKELGKLKGLIVDGPVVINQHVFYDANTDRLGLGTDQPNAAVSIVEDGVEISIGSKEGSRAVIGTYASHDLEIITDNTARIFVSASGNIQLGNPNRTPINVNVNGRLSINVEVPDPSVDLHVKGAARINNKLHLSAGGPPKAGSYSLGDIVWNNQPRQRGHIGWVCTQAGNPGIWNPFGEIK